MSQKVLQNAIAMAFCLETPGRKKEETIGVILYVPESNTNLSFYQPVRTLNRCSKIIINMGMDFADGRYRRKK
jgi:hypothetical protein